MQYICSMHCEGDKIYPSFGKCPVCGMNLKEVTGDQIEKLNSIKKLVNCICGTLDCNGSCVTNCLSVMTNALRIQGVKLK